MADSPDTNGGLGRTYAHTGGSEEPWANPSNATDMALGYSNAVLTTAAGMDKSSWLQIYQLDDLNPIPDGQICTGVEVKAYIKHTDVTGPRVTAHAGLATGGSNAQTKASELHPSGILLANDNLFYTVTFGGDGDLFNYDEITNDTIGLNFGPAIRVVSDGPTGNDPCRVDVLQIAYYFADPVTGETSRSAVPALISMGVF